MESAAFMDLHAFGIEVSTPGRNMLFVNEEDAELQPLANYRGQLNVSSNHKHSGYNYVLDVAHRYHIWNVQMDSIHPDYEEWHYVFQQYRGLVRVTILEKTSFEFFCSQVEDTLSSLKNLEIQCRLQRINQNQLREIKDLCAQKGRECSVIYSLSSELYYKLHVNEQAAYFYMPLKHKSTLLLSLL